MEETDEKKVEEMMLESRRREAVYSKMRKEDLVNTLVLRDLFESSAELWCYVADETGLKYLSDKRPEECETPDGGAKVYLTDGEVNIRVPRSLERLFPGLEYGDAPLRVRMSVSF